LICIVTSVLIRTPDASDKTSIYMTERNPVNQSCVSIVEVSTAGLMI